MQESEVHNLRENFELEIHSFRAAWWVRYGIMASIALVLVVVILAAVIQYPQHVTGTFRLYSTKTALSMPLQKGRKIERIWLKAGEKTRKGQVILSYTDNARLSDIEEVESIVESGIKGGRTYYQLYQAVASSVFELGSLQQAFTELHNLLLENYLYLEYAEDEVKIENLKADLKSLESIREEGLKLLDVDREEGNLVKAQFEMHASLFRDSVIAREEYMSRKEQHLSKIKLHQQNTLSYKRTEAEIIRLNSTIQELENIKDEKQTKIRARIRSVLGAFAVAIAKWKEDNLVIAPIDGQVNFIGYFNEDEVSSGEDNSIVITPTSTGYKALVEIPFTRAGEVKRGRKVVLKLDDFPYREYGILEGELSTVADVAGRESYLCEVRLDQSMVSTGGERIIFKERMGGIAQIVTEDRTVLGILFDKIVYMFKK